MQSDLLGMELQAVTAPGVGAGLNMGALEEQRALL